MFITMVVGLYTSRVLLNILGVEDYGLYNVVGGIISFLSFLSGTMTNTTSRFVTFALSKNDINKHNQIFNMTFIIHVVFALLILFLGETVGLLYLNEKLVIPEGREVAAFWIFQFSIISSIFTIISVPFNATIIGHEKMNAFAYISIFDAMIKLIIVFVIEYAGFDKLIFYGLLLTLMSCFNVIIYIYYCKKKFPEIYFKWYWNVASFKEMMTFAGWGVVGNFSYVFYSQGVNLMLNAFFGPAVNAARGIAIQVEGLTRQFANNVQVAINPQIIKSYSIGDLERMYTLVFASSRYCFFLLFIISLPIMVEADFILNIWLINPPEHTSNFIRIILCTTLLDAFINPMFTSNLASGKLKIYQLSVCSVSYVFMIITYLVICLTNLPECVFITIFISTVIGVIVRIYVLKKQIGLKPDRYLLNVIRPVFLVVFSSIIIPIFIYVSFESGWLRFVLNSFFSILSIIIMVCIFGINKVEKSFVKNKIINMLNLK